jgi:hypothetical protein
MDPIDPQPPGWSGAAAGGGRERGKAGALDSKRPTMRPIAILRFVCCVLFWPLCRCQSTHGHGLLISAAILYSMLFHYLRYT